MVHFYNISKFNLNKYIINNQIITTNLLNSITSSILSANNNNNNNNIKRIYYTNNKCYFIKTILINNFELKTSNFLSNKYYNTLFKINYMEKHTNNSNVTANTSNNKETKVEKSKEEIEAERKKRREEKAASKALKKEKEINNSNKTAKNNEEKSKNINNNNKEHVKKEKKIYVSNAKLIRPNNNKPIYVDFNKKNVLITSALPYVNNEPHLGNIIGCVLSADVYARYCRLAGYNTLYICGTDEYGTATETKALKENITPKELCDKYHAMHKDIYNWFDIDFDYFGRTPTELHSKITQDVFLKNYNNNNMNKKLVKQFKCLNCNRFLADRYVEGTCYFKGCGYEQAGGDQCDKCGKLINAIELINPKCKVCSKLPEIVESYHYFINLPKIEPELKKWLFEASKEWSYNSTNLAKGFLTDGLVPRCITRDLKWGVEVPVKSDNNNNNNNNNINNSKYIEDKDLKDKVFYVWFDAPIGYLSITANFLGEDKWESWWKDPKNIKLYQFMGKDNVTFHSIMFPSCLIGTGENYTKVNALSTTEYLTYEGNKFSKSKQVGVFGSNAKETGIPSEVWRYYLLANRPETGDTDFFWDKFAEKVNSELINNLGNLCNRVFAFINNRFESLVPEYNNDLKTNKEDEEHVNELNRLFEAYVNSLEKVRLREGLEILMKISTQGNLYLTNTAPWDLLKKKDKKRCEEVLFILMGTIRLISCLAEPYLPAFSAKVYEIIGVEYNEYNAELIKHLNKNFKLLFLETLCCKGNKLKESNPLFGESKIYKLIEYN